MVLKLSKSEHERINTAIARAEAFTSGEILCVVKHEADGYREVPLAWAAASALVLPLAVLPLGFLPVRLNVLLNDWTAAHAASANLIAGSAVAGYAALQALVFALVYLLVSIPPVRRALTPRAIKRRRAHRYAVEQFLSQGMHLTEARTGVMIFASLADHHAEVVADEGIYSKVDQRVWKDAVDLLTAELKAGRVAVGFEKAIEACGKVLAQHFPPSPDNPNERPDRLVEL